MTADEHNKTLATLWFIYGAMHGLTLFGLMVLGLLFKFASTAGDLISSFWMFISVMTFILLLFVVALLPLLVALGGDSFADQYSDWHRARYLLYQVFAQRSWSKPLRGQSIIGDRRGIGRRDAWRAAFDELG